MQTARSYLLKSGKVTRECLGCGFVSPNFYEMVIHCNGCQGVRVINN